MQIIWYHTTIALTNKLAWDLNTWLRYLTGWVSEKNTDAYSTELYGPHADLVGAYILCAMLLGRHPTLPYEYRHHYTQYNIVQSFTGWWQHSSGVTRVRYPMLSNVAFETTFSNTSWKVLNIYAVKLHCWEKDERSFDIKKVRHKVRIGGKSCES